MSFASICRVCLTNNKRMKIIANTQLQTIFENLTRNQLITGDGRPDAVCYLCHQLLLRCCKFVDLSRRAEESLTHLLYSGVGLNQHALTVNCTTVQNDSPYTLTMSVTNFISISINSEESKTYEVVVKADPSSEVPANFDHEEQRCTVKLDTDGIYYGKKEEIKPDDFEENSDSDNGDSDSSNVPLTTFRQDTTSPGTLGNRRMKLFKLKKELNSTENPSLVTPKRSKESKPCRDGNVKKHAALTKDNRARIVSLSKQGCSIHEISRQLNVTRNTVKRWIKRHGEEGFLKDRRQYNKGTRRITDEQLIEMQQHIEQHPFTPLHYFAARYDACLKTIRKCLYSTGYHHRLCKKVPLTDAQRLERLNFARGYLDFDWSNVIFSGEKSFTSQRSRLTLKRYSLSQDSEDQSNQVSGSNTASMWGWMSASSVGEIVNISNGDNACNYVDLLEESFLPTVRTVYPQEDVPYILYVHDNTPEHTARFVTEWFYQHPEIYVIPWPSKSQDLNPMENLWGLMIEMWDKRNERTGLEIEEYCNEIWEFVRGSEICSRLVESMRARLQGVIDSNGA